MNIRLYKLFDRIDLKKLTYQHNDDAIFCNVALPTFSILSIINFILPVKYKFMSDTYVAVENNEIIGLISLTARKNNPYKWEINKLYLNEYNYYEIGKSLIDFAVSRYCSKGVETFEIDIKNNFNELIDLFSKECGFRYCSDYQLYKIDTKHYKMRNADTENIIFRPFKNTDIIEISELYNQNISPYYKFPLSKIPNEYNDDVFKGLSKKSLLKYVIEDKYTKKIKGYIEIQTTDNEIFIMETVLLQSYENCLEDIITFSISQISRKTKNYNLYFKNCKFHINSDVIENMLSERGNELINTDMIFVKDFFKQIKEKDIITNNAIKYNEINGKPVYKI